MQLFELKNKKQNELNAIWYKYMPSDASILGMSIHRTVWRSIDQPEVVTKLDPNVQMTHNRSRYLFRWVGHLPTGPGVKWIKYSMA